jgi:hypothetical protein
VLRRDAGIAEHSELPAAGLAREGLSFRYRDTACEAGKTFVYRVEVVDDSGRRVLFDTGPVLVPRMILTLFQNHPNPFNPATEIAYCLPEAGRVELTVHAVDGGLVAILVDREEGPGRHTVHWNGRDSRGREIASGVYLCRLRAGKAVLSIKMILAR